MPLFRVASLAFLLAPLFALSGCAGSPTFKAWADLARTLTAPSAAAAPSDPRFRYLKVETQGRTAYFVLGYVEAMPLGPVEVWYSGEREVIRLLDGRLLSGVGMATEWLTVEYEGLPRWQDVQAPVEYWRRRDVAPGYRFGLAERLQLRPIPSLSRPGLDAATPDALRWFEERVLDGEALPPSRYAVRWVGDQVEVVYAEVCLDARLCFSWQRWQP